MQGKSLFELTIVSNLPVEPFLVPSVNRIFEQNGIRIRIATVNYDEYCSTKSLQRFAESDFIVILLNFENTYQGLLDEDSLTEVSAIVESELEKARRIRDAISKNSNAFGTDVRRFFQLRYRNGHEYARYVSRLHQVDGGKKHLLVGYQKRRGYGVLVS